MQCGKRLKISPDDKIKTGVVLFLNKRQNKFLIILKNSKL